MGQLKRAMAERAQWLVLFTLLLFALGAVPVLADTTAGDGALPPETELASPESQSMPTAEDLANATERIEEKEGQRARELESPAAIAEREESEDAYKDL